MIKIIKIGSSWCGPCKMLSPILEKLQKEMGFELEEVSIDDGLPEEYEQYNITSVPVLLFFKDNEFKLKEVGFKAENKIKAIINEILV